VSLLARALNVARKGKTIATKTAKNACELLSGFLTTEISNESDRGRYADDANLQL
jgi:hypothetical protein